MAIRIIGFSQVAIADKTVIREKTMKIRKSLIGLFIPCGGGGIRTHACLRTIDFQSIGMVHYPTPPVPYIIPYNPGKIIRRGEWAGR